MEYPRTRENSRSKRDPLGRPWALNDSSNWWQNPFSTNARFSGALENAHHARSVYSPFLRSLFRAITGFVAQFGINGDPSVQSKYVNDTILDDPVKQTNARGTITFATAGENTRTSQMFINTAIEGNGGLDARGFSPIGEVVKGIEVVDRFYAEYGEASPNGSGPPQDGIQMGGNAFLEGWPLLSYFERVYFLEEPPVDKESILSIVSFASNHLDFHPWYFVSDSVTEGRSEGSYTNLESVGILKGTVRDVPTLSTPGFIEMETPASTRFPDARTCTHVRLEAKTVGPNLDYAGWRFGLGNSQPEAVADWHAFGHKHGFFAPGNEWENVTMPLNQFSNYWNATTGDVVITCEEDPQYCPTSQTLKEIKTLSIWAEGVNGDVELHVRNIWMTGCNLTALPNPNQVDELITSDSGVIQVFFLLSILSIALVAVF